MFPEEKSFSISRKSIGLAPLIRENNHILNNCLRLNECEKFLNLNEIQLSNGIKKELLKTINFGESVYICIYSALKVKKDKNLLQAILDCDEITAQAAAKILGIQPKYIKRLIEDGYLTQPEKGYRRGLKIGEVNKLVSEIKEIRSFWLSQARINRQISVKRATAARKIIRGESFKEQLFQEMENKPYKKAILIKTAYALMAVNYYINRKLTGNIIDHELIFLRQNCLEKFISFYSDSLYLKAFYPEMWTKTGSCCGFSQNIFNCPNCVQFISEKENLAIITIEIKLEDFSFRLNFPFLTKKELQKKALITPADDAFWGMKRINNQDLKSFKFMDLFQYLSSFSL